MSAQSVIDDHLRRGHYNVTVKNETGNVVVPENANVHFFDCQLGSFTVKGNSAVFLGRTEVAGSVFTEDCQFIAQNCKFKGEIVWAKNTIVKSVSGSRFYLRITAKQNTMVTIFDSGWDGFGSFAMYALDKSRVTISNSKLEKRTKGAWAKQGSFIDLNNCTVATSTGIVCEDDSQVNMVGGELNVTEIGVQIKNKSQVYLSDVAPVKGTVLHVEMENESKLISNRTDFSPTPPTSIKAKNKCLIEIMNAGVIKSTGGDCIDLKDDCVARFIQVGTIESAGGTAIKGKNNCLINLVDVTTVEGKGKYGVDLQDNKCKLEASKGSLIKGLTGGIKADKESLVTINNWKEIIGQSEPGITLSKDSRAHLSNVTKVESTGSDGIKLSKESDISLQNHGTVRGVGGSGINANADCTIQLQTVMKVEGIAGDGIKASKNTNIDIIYTDLINGKTGKGISAENNCDVRITRSKRITGKTGGVRNDGNGTLVMELVSQVKPESGFGIECIDTEVHIKLVDIIKKGVKFKDCETVLRDCPSINNDAGAGITVEGGQLDLRSVSATGTNSLSTSGAVINLVAATLSGNISSASDVYRVFKSTATGVITMAGSNLHSMSSSFTTITLDGTSSAILMATSGIVAGAGSVIAMNSGAVTAGMNRIEMFPANINIQNNNNTQIAEISGDILMIEGS